jgi:hypothetical protein
VTPSDGADQHADFYKLSRLLRWDALSLRILRILPNYTTPRRHDKRHLEDQFSSVARLGVVQLKLKPFT